MCGIFCGLVKKHETSEGDCSLLVKQIETNILNRGPDQYATRLYSEDCYNCFIATSVLWLQGPSCVKQPTENPRSIFAYNGDIYAGLGESSIVSSDTTLLHDLLDNSENISKALYHLQGPYAFIYIDKRERKLYFCRDAFGRRSLLLAEDKNSLIISSVAARKTKYTFIELPSIGVFCFDLKKGVLSVDAWWYKHANFTEKLNEVKLLIGKDILVNKQIETINYHVFRPPTDDNLSIFNEIKNTSKEEVLETLLKCDVWLKNVRTLEELLSKSIKKRISKQPVYCKNCIKGKLRCHHSRTGILFSGGLDSAVLAVLADKFEDRHRSIDLMNVAFDEAKNYETPDRLFGRQTLDELRKCCPQRNWNFVEINISKEQLDTARRDHIADLIYPLNTILDDSLGCALWFASKGVSREYVSPCRIVLVGMGADELFGGYMRHRAAFRRGSWSGLNAALEEDWQNISFRNLARDNRVISDHGRESRTPYLDENVVNFVKSLNCWEKTYPSDHFPSGVGEKILLRSLCYHLGLKQAATFKKTALQFGSRIAISKENACDISYRLC